MIFGLVLLGVLAVLVLLYTLNNAARFYMRCTLFYFCIFLNGVVTCVTGIPFTFFGMAGQVGMISMRILSMWTGATIEVRDFDRVYSKQTTPCVVLCNHQSALDIMLMGHTFPPRGTVMMKRSLAYIPLFNFACWLCDAIFVDRFNRERAQMAVKQCTDALTKKNLKLWVFPEGTRNIGGMIPFKKGAFNIAVDAQIPIVPMVASSYAEFFDPEIKRFDSDGEIICQILDPIPTKGLTLDDVPALVESTREKMMATFDKLTVEANARMAAKRGSKKTQ